MEGCFEFGGVGEFYAVEGAVGLGFVRWGAFVEYVCGV